MTEILEDNLELNNTGNFTIITLSIIKSSY